ncbi:MAG TPA: hypothetical protein VFQ43_03190, partial [Nitrososphaera sp.]|nr:hypothetical protein [Nitrososphaera sp.]
MSEITRNWVSFFLVAIVVFAAEVTTAQNATTTTSLLFTGKLMGYFRVPDRQPGPGHKVDLANPCTFEDEKGQRLPPSPDADILLNIRRQEPTKILLGMGDNFAPNYFSRAFENGDGKHPYEKGKDVYSWNGDDWIWFEDGTANTKEALEGHETIPTDNVGCFLSKAGYAAVVPGKHDFYYGPQRLRALARFMASIPTNYPEFRPVQMLASNLMIKTSWLKDHTPIPASGKPKLPFTSKFVSNVLNRSLEIDDFTEDGYAMPWMQAIRVTAAGWDEKSLKEHLHLFLCWAEKDPDKFLDHCHDKWLVQPLYDKSATDASDIIHLSYKLPLDRLLADVHSKESSNFAVCALAPDMGTKQPGKSPTMHSKEEPRPYCVQFAVYQPFFQYPDWPSGGGNSTKDVRYSNPLPYALSEDRHTVIFGVVDPKLREHIGGENVAWRNVRVESSSDLANPSVDKRYTTQITVADPVQALVQLYDYFKSRNPDFAGRRVLLAQMPANEAKQLAEHLPACLRFDVVIAEADDALASPNADLNVHPRGAPMNVCNEDCLEGIAIKTASNSNTSVQAPPATVFVPPSHQLSPFSPY